MYFHIVKQFGDEYRYLAFIEHEPTWVRGPANVRSYAYEEARKLADKHGGILVEI